MGYEVFAAKSTAQLQKHIRSISTNTAMVLLTAHAKSRMRVRHVGIGDVFECLRLGVIKRTPEPNLSKGNLECCMQRYVAGRECAVVVALDDAYLELVVVTVLLVN